MWNTSAGLVLVAMMLEVFPHVLLPISAGIRNVLKVGVDAKPFVDLFLTRPRHVFSEL
ncbi:hypothetical protein TBK1r_48600 [Stieleria magnilauensis]|uniref:Uncharacterized protein n=1 Tax=Stieleria magnilauensis TaxID=2527963 RepID=A0ABX5XUZ1_9BACT|nr:hypothetical protein TBK1r_48600 [Planctomycetes bacterium TBK1r]